MDGFPARVDSRAAPLVGEVLTPGAPVPEAVSKPAIVKLWQDGARREFFIRLADGGVWTVSMAEIVKINPREIRLDLHEMFAERADLFTFVNRKDPVRVKRAHGRG